MTARPCILVVEDDPVLRRYLHAALGECGYDACLAANADEAMQHLAGQRLHLVLTDMLMPGEDGVSLLARLRREYPGLPVVVMSGRGPVDLSVDSLSLVRMLGASATLEKPFALAELERTLAFVLARG